MSRISPSFPVRLSAPGRVSAWQRARLAAEILADYVSLLRALRRDGLTTVLARVRAAGRPSAGRPVAGEHELAVRLGSIVGRVLAPLPTDNRCLIRSLVLVRILARRSIGAELVIGARLDGGFAAHAWVEHDDVPLLPRLGFDPLTRL